MTKKHYEAIASILFENGCDIDKTITIAKDLANYFETENPRFDRARFLAACGIDEYHPLAHHSDCAKMSQLENPNSRHYKGCHACGYTGR